MEKLKITQIKSAAGRLRKQKLSLLGLGLGKIGKTAVLQNTPEVQGMIKVVNHMIKVEGA